MDTIELKESKTDGKAEGCVSVPIKARLLAYPQSLEAQSDIFQENSFGGPVRDDPAGKNKKKGKGEEEKKGGGNESSKLLTVI